MLHDALDPKGYTFAPVDITQPNAHLNVISPFVMGLYDSSNPEAIFTSTVANNLRNIARNYPVVIFGEFRSWKAYDNYILQNVALYTADELYYDRNEFFANSKFNPDNAFGSQLIASGVTTVLNNCLGTIGGTLAQQHAIALSTDSNKATMLLLPFRETVNDKNSLGLIKYFLYK